MVSRRKTAARRRMPGARRLAVPIRTRSTFSAGEPKRLFGNARHFSDRSVRAGWTYDMSPDGQRFLVIKNVSAAGTSANTNDANIVVVLNWCEELKEKMR
jgi:hypothetical protein